MHRIINFYLEAWKKDPYRRSLIVRGARQIGKTYAVRQLGKTFDQFVEVNFEVYPKLAALFDQDLDPKRIMRDLCAAMRIRSIEPGTTLLFFDEIQAVPQAIIALRYFYEMVPELHVIAAGSLLDFAVEQVGMPVGRVQSLYMYPVSFIEYLLALGEYQTVNAIFKHDPTREMSAVIHNKLLSLLAHYMAIGGMPQVVQVWRDTQDLYQCAQIHQALINSYRQDFYKYARTQQIKYLQAIFDNIPLQLGRKFKYSNIEGNYRSRELSPGLDLLCTADVAHKVWHTAGNGIPIGAQKNLDDFKTILLDVGISQALLGLQLDDWLLNYQMAFVNKGELVEGFVGQELLAYTNPMYDAALYYWHRHKVGGEAEIDYLIQQQEQIIPIEVKSGKGSTLKSMHSFLESHPQTLRGVRFSTQNYSMYEKIQSYPLYAVASIMLNTNQAIIDFLTEHQQ